MTGGARPTAAANGGHTVDLKAVSLYGGVLRDQIKRLKYGGETVWAEQLGRVLLRGLERGYAAGEWDLVVPNPTHVARPVRHTELIVQAAADADAARRWTFDDPANPCLVKRSPTPRSYRGGPEARQVAAERLYTALEVPRPELVVGRRLLVVDDVATTGSQLDQVAGKLGEDGASGVGVLVLTVSPEFGLRADVLEPDAQPPQDASHQGAGLGRRPVARPGVAAADRLDRLGEHRPAPGRAQGLAALAARLDTLREDRPAADGPGLGL